MRKIEILNKITEIGVVAVVRAENAEVAIKISDACIKGGIPAIEVTYTVPGATKVIEALSEKFSDDELIVGAGTVLDSETAKLCNRYQIPYLPGVATITETLKAMEYGATIVKLFPGSAFGPSYVKAIKGPLPQANIMPTGGVSLDNVKDWIKAGVVAVGVGGDLTAPAKKGDYEGVQKNAKAFVEQVRIARENK